MKYYRMNLQLFGEGGDGGAAGAAGTGSGSLEGVAESGAVATRYGSKDDSLDSVIYGKQPEVPENNQTDVKTTTPEQRKAEFEKLIKGEYKEEFQKRTQGIINDRFKETKGLQEQLKSHNELITMLSDRYGVDANDVSALTKAIEDDERFLRDEAIEKGLTVKQLKEIKALERENAAFKQAQEEAENKAKADQTLAKWMEEGDVLKAKYGLEGFDLNTEAQNPDFVRLLQNGVSVESAYMAMHFDDMLGGAMAHTANAVRTGMANSIGQRASRVTENGVSAKNNATFKTDVNQLTKADRDKIDKLVARGAVISF